MKKLFFILLIVSAISISGCANVRPIRQGDTQPWYGRVNYWANSKSLVKKETRTMRRYGTSGYIIEMAGWAGSANNRWTEDWLREIDNRYKHLVRHCRKNGLWLFVSIVNDNMGTGKYDDPGIPLSEVFPQAQQLCQIVKKHGNKNVIVQPVAETRTPAGQQFETYCLQNLSEFIMVYNGDYGRPDSMPQGYDYKAYHPHRTVDAVPSEAFIISDTGSIILELSIDSTYDGKGNPDKLKEWFKLVENRNQPPVCGYYAFKRKDFDKESIKALGEAGKK